MRFGDPDLDNGIIIESAKSDLHKLLMYFYL